MRGGSLYVPLQQPRPGLPYLRQGNGRERLRGDVQHRKRCRVTRSTRVRWEGTAERREDLQQLGDSVHDQRDCGVGTSSVPGCELAKVCEAGIDGVLGNADDFPGAGICVPDARNCFVQPVSGEGGDTLNGNGDPTNVNAVSTFCIGSTSNNAINSTAGLGGPGRLRQIGVNVTNGFATLP